MALTEGVDPQGSAVTVPYANDSYNRSLPRSGSSADTRSRPTSVYRARTMPLRAPFVHRVPGWS